MRRSRDTFRVKKDICICALEAGSYFGIGEVYLRLERQNTIIASQPGSTTYVLNQSHGKYFEVFRDVERWKNNKQFLFYMNEKNEWREERYRFLQEQYKNLENQRYK